VRIDRLLGRQRVQRIVQPDGGCRHGVRQFARPRRNSIDAIEPDERGGVVDRVHHGIERRRQGIEILAVEWRDERPVEPLDGVVGERVATVLGVLDGLDMNHGGRFDRKHLLEQVGGHLDLVGHLAEELEELLVTGKKAESERHHTPPACACGPGDCNGNVTSM
jgi:hypothetical protein